MGARLLSTQSRSCVQGITGDREPNVEWCPICQERPPGRVHVRVCTFCLILGGES